MPNAGELAERAQEQRDREREQKERERDQETSAYDRGQQALDQSRWDRAVSAFDRVASMKGPKADAALYWKAYAQNKQGLRTEALGTIAELNKSYPKSRYLQDRRRWRSKCAATPGNRCVPRTRATRR